jgi:hypothetical protein
MTFKDNCKKLARWILVQIDRIINPLKYETKTERIERQRREDREHEIRLAQLNRETHHYEHRSDDRDHQEGINNINARLGEEVGFKGPYSEFDSWSGSGNGYSKLFRKGKGRKPKDPCII